MDARFRVAIATMLAGLAVWGAFFVVGAFAGPDAWSPWLGAGMCLAAGVLIAFSGFS